MPIYQYYRQENLAKAICFPEYWRNFAATPAARWVAGVEFLYDKGCAAGCGAGMRERMEYGVRIVLDSVNHCLHVREKSANAAWCGVCGLVCCQRRMSLRLTRSMAEVSIDLM